MVYVPGSNPAFNPITVSYGSGNRLRQASDPVPRTAPFSFSYGNSGNALLSSVAGQAPGSASREVDRGVTTFNGHSCLSAASTIYSAGGGNGYGCRYTYNTVIEAPRSTRGTATSGTFPAV